MTRDRDLALAVNDDDVLVTTSVLINKAQDNKKRYPWLFNIQAAFRTYEIRRTPQTPQDEKRAGMSFFHETIWNGVLMFLRRVDIALKNIGIDERVPYNVPLMQFSS
ncbi:unnamed protein product [Brassica rapa subsp. trilocularis]